MPPPASFESPFHVRGHVTQKDAAAWKAMKWHDSPIIQELLIIRYRLGFGAIELSQKEHAVANIPPVAVAVVSDLLFRGVESQLATIDGDMLVRGSDLLIEALGVLMASSFVLDLDEIQYYYDRYFGELFPPFALRGR